MAPPGGGSNLDAHHDRESIVDAHAVEFSKTAEYISEGSPSEKTDPTHAQGRLRADRGV
jgi:hypothetical protein